MNDERNKTQSIIVNNSNRDNGLNSRLHILLYYYNTDGFQSPQCALILIRPLTSELS